MRRDLFAKVASECMEQRQRVVAALAFVVGQIPTVEVIERKEVVGKDPLRLVTDRRVIAQASRQGPQKRTSIDDFARSRIELAGGEVQELQLLYTQHAWRGRDHVEWHLLPALPIEHIHPDASCRCTLTTLTRRGRRVTLSKLSSGHHPRTSSSWRRNNTVCFPRC